jgi:hypothetical protein
VNRPTGIDTGASLGGQWTAPGLWRRRAEEADTAVVESDEPNPEDLTEEEEAALWFWRSWKTSGAPSPENLASLKSWEREIVRRVFADDRLPAFAPRRLAVR